MEWIQSLIDSSQTPVLTAFILGLLTAISPCPLATNIAAVGYIGKHADSKVKVFSSGLMYTLGRIIAYTVLGIAIITVIKAGESAFGIEKFLSHTGEKLIGPLLLVIGLFMLLGHRLNLKGFGFSGDGRKLKDKGMFGALGLGVLFSLTFCPTSAVFYFGMLIPMSAAADAGSLLPLVFAISTALPVLLVSWILAFSVHSLGKFIGKVNAVQRWLNIIVAVLFIGIGIYYIITIIV